MNSLTNSEIEEFLKPDVELPRLISCTSVCIPYQMIDQSLIVACQDIQNKKPGYCSHADRFLLYMFPSIPCKTILDIRKEKGSFTEAYNYMKENIDVLRQNRVRPNQGWPGNNLDSSMGGLQKELDELDINLETPVVL